MLVYQRVKAVTGAQSIIKYSVLTNPEPKSKKETKRCRKNDQTSQKKIETVQSHGV